MGPNPEFVRNMFSQVASRYDLANSLLSLGWHHHWRKALVRESQAHTAQKILDCATGTGDLAFALAKAAPEDCEVIGLDFCGPMIELARQKALKKRSRAQFQVADVCELPFSGAQFDLVTMSFGIRNVAEPTKALKEMLRVTHPGGELCILEFGQIPHTRLQTLWEGFSRRLLPTLGGMVTGQRPAYEYLHKSSQNFPCGQSFLNILQQAGWTQPFFIPLSLGVVYLYIAYRSESA